MEGEAMIRCGLAVCALLFTGAGAMAQSVNVVHASQPDLRCTFDTDLTIIVHMTPDPEDPMTASFQGQKVPLDDGGSVGTELWGHLFNAKFGKDVYMLRMGGAKVRVGAKHVTPAELTVNPGGDAQPTLGGVCVE